jgi:hypothetical protein
MTLPSAETRCQMARATTNPFALLSTAGLTLLCSCGTAGSQGGASNPPEPVPFAEMEAILSESPQAPSELFTSDAPLHFVLAADFDQLSNDRSQDVEDRPAQILIMGPDGKPVEIPSQVRTRGNFRLQRRTCTDPPLRLNLPETRPQGTILDGQDKLKLVTHCRDRDLYEQNVLEEYLVYRIYNQLTDLSFRVQLAEITYLDASGKNDPIQRMGFLIEDDGAMAARLGGRMIEAPVANPDDFVRDQLGLMYLFQFMVGNVDWGTGSSHNSKILFKDREYFPIPYDFDWAGLVDAPYAGPNQMTARFHDSVRERVYWGACLSGLDHEALFDRFRAEREGILELVRTQPGLSERNRDSAVRYLEDFYSIIDDPRTAERVILNACRKW